MKFEIKSRWTGNVLFNLETDSLKLCIEAAVKQGAYLKGAYLKGAYLEGAYLKGAYLKGAYLEGADLKGAYLEGADLEGANLEGAYLKGAYLKGADLEGADLEPIRDDLWAILSAAPKEVEGLRQAIIDGKVDGSTYIGKCACLVGTIAKVAKLPYGELPILKPQSQRPAERFFLGISEGDTPKNNQFSKLALEWVDQWLENMKSAFSVEVKK